MTRIAFPARAGRLTLALGLAAAALPAAAQGVTQADDISDIAAAVEKYADVNAALADGYIPDPSGHCVDAGAEGLPAEWGAMGIHYLHPERLGVTATSPRVDGTGTNTDFAQPSILLYEPQEDGSMRLVGLENLVFEAAWLASGNTEGPTSMGRAWDHMADDPATEGDEAHGFMPHWDQHVWLVENPAGNLMPFNPAVSCAHAAHMN